MPEVDSEALTQFLERLPDHYFANFAISEQALHAQATARLGSENPVELLIDLHEDTRLDVTVIAFDHASVFAMITGILSASGMNILKGDVFTYAPVEYQRPHRRPRRDSARLTREKNLRRRRIIDHFSGTFESSGLTTDDWIERLRKRFHSIFARLESGGEDTQTVKRRVDELVAERLAQLEQEGEPAVMPVTIDIDNDTSPTCTRLKVISDDTPAFLYALSNSLALRRLSIEHVKIRTTGTRIQDEVDVVDSGGKKIVEPAALNQLKLSALLTKHFTYFLGSSSNPFDALTRFEQMLDDILKLPERERWTNMLSDPRILQDLARLLGTSDFMWEDFIRQQYETLLPMMQPHVQGRSFSDDGNEFEAQLAERVDAAKTLDDKKRTLNQFKDRQIFLIDLDHILTPDVDFKILAHRLTRLAEAVVAQAVATVYADIAATHGIPRTVAGIEARFAVLGLGKMGGAALGYASDIELLFVYSDNGGTDGAKPVANSEFFDLLVQRVNQFIETKREGIFNIDLRLRPYGGDGPLACSLENFCRYYGQDGPAHSFERLALVRMRAIAGDPELGGQLERIRDDVTYFTHSINLAELRGLREKQFREKNVPGQVNAKFSPGALVDLEYDVQILQVMYGREHPELRTPRLHQALDGLAAAGVITEDESLHLIDAYGFLRRLINGLRMLRGSARDLLLPPIDSDEFTHLARRMGYQRGGELSAAQQLRLDFDTETATVRAFVERHFGRDSLPGSDVGNVADLILADDVPDELATRILSVSGFKNTGRALTNLRRLRGNDPKRRDTFAKLAILACDMLRNQPAPDMALNNWERFIDKSPDPGEHFSMLLSQPMRLELLLGVFAASQFLADTLVRNPEFIDWVTVPDNVRKARTMEDIAIELRQSAEACKNYDEWLDLLRVFRRREMLRIGVRDICLRVRTDSIITELSDLAEAIVRIALEQVWQRETGTPTPDMARRFCILAFGKLGGRELNYSSDIDLLALCSPRNSEEIKPFAHVMETTCAALHSHTPEGHAYRVDLRLRPYGKSGELVHTQDGLLAYYRDSAAAWEVQALLKLRPLAGNIDLGNKLVKALSEFLQVRRKQSEIAATIDEMRNKTMKMQSRRILNNAPDIKNGRGGIRDVEFLVQGLQLLHAPDHPELVGGHTLEALRALVAVGAMDEEHGETIAADYLFLRKVEHCLQILEDRQVHRLPTDPEELDALAKRALGLNSDGETFLTRLNECLDRVRSAYEEFC